MNKLFSSNKNREIRDMQIPLTTLEVGSLYRLNKNYTALLLKRRDVNIFNKPIAKYNINDYYAHSFAKDDVILIVKKLYETYVKDITCTKHVLKRIRTKYLFLYKNQLCMTTKWTPPLEFSCGEKI